MSTGRGFLADTSPSRPPRYLSLGPQCNMVSKLLDTECFRTCLRVPVETMGQGEAEAGGEEVLQ